MTSSDMFYGATPEIFARAKELRENMTFHETMLWNRLKANQIMGIRFKPQHPIEQFIADFYCHQLKLVIEIDGNSHDKEELSEIDIYRSEVMSNLGIKTMRFTNRMIEKDIEKVIEEIEKIVKRDNNYLKGTTQKTIHKISNSSKAQLNDTIAIEAPLEIKIKKEADLMGKSVAVTMRTPGNDVELALGFIFTEGMLKDSNDILEAEIKDDNVIEVLIKNEADLNLGNSDRNFYTTSSCGVCGKASIDAIKVDSSFEIKEGVAIDKSLLFILQDRLLEEQSAFEATGGIHASALFDLSGKLVALLEDVGRHNALDKLIGISWQKEELPLSESILLLSGRASFELVQKASMAGIPIIVAVGAPSSLAIELAEENGHTLVGFLKSDRFNIYTGHERIKG